MYLQYKNYQEGLVSQPLLNGSDELFIDSLEPMPVPFVLTLTGGYTLFDLRNSEAVLCYEEIDEGQYKVARDWDNFYAIKNGSVFTVPETLIGVTDLSVTGLTIGDYIRFRNHRQLYRVEDTDGSTATITPPLQATVDGELYICGKQHLGSRERAHTVGELAICVAGYAQFEELQDSFTNFQLPSNLTVANLEIGSFNATSGSVGELYTPELEADRIDAKLIVLEANTEDEEVGAIRFNGIAFQGYIGDEWVNFGSADGLLPSGEDGDILINFEGTWTSTDLLSYGEGGWFTGETFRLGGGLLIDGPIANQGSGLYVGVEDGIATIATSDLEALLIGLEVDGIRIEPSMVAVSVDGTDVWVATPDRVTHTNVLGFLESEEPAAPEEGDIYFDAVHGLRTYTSSGWRPLTGDPVDFATPGNPWSTVHYDPVNGWQPTDALLLSNNNAVFSNSLVVGQKDPNVPLQAGLIEFVNNDLQVIVRHGVNQYARVSLTGNSSFNRLPVAIDRSFLVGSESTGWVATEDLILEAGRLIVPRIQLTNKAFGLGSLEGTLRYNTVTQGVEIHNGTVWTALIAEGGNTGTLLPLPALGGSILFTAGGGWIESTAYEVSDLLFKAPAIETNLITLGETEISGTLIKVSAIEAESLSVGELDLDTLTLQSLVLPTITVAGTTIAASVAGLGFTQNGSMVFDLNESAQAEEILLANGTLNTGLRIAKQSISWVGGTVTTSDDLDHVLITNQTEHSTYTLIWGDDNVTLPAGVTIALAKGSPSSISGNLVILGGLASGPIATDWVRVGEYSSGMTPLPGTIRYNGDFQGYVQTDDEGAWQSFTLSIADGDLTDSYGTLLWWDGTQWLQNSGLRASDDGALLLGSALTAPAVEGAIRYNSTTHVFEACADEGVWTVIASGNENGAGELPPGTTVHSSLRWNGSTWVENASILLGTKELIAPLVHLGEYANISSPNLPNGGEIRYNQNDYEGFMLGVGWVSFTGKRAVLPTKDGDPLLDTGHTLYFNGTNWVADHFSYNSAEQLQLEKNLWARQISGHKATFGQIQLDNLEDETLPVGSIVFNGSIFRGRVGDGAWLPLNSPIREEEVVAGQLAIKGSDEYWYNTAALSLTDVFAIGVEETHLNSTESGNWIWKSQEHYLGDTLIRTLRLQATIMEEEEERFTDLMQWRSDGLLSSPYGAMFPNIRIGTFSYGTDEDPSLEAVTWLRPFTVGGDGLITGELQTGSLISGVIEGTQISGSELYIGGRITGLELRSTDLEVLTSGFFGSYVRVGYSDDPAAPRGAIRYSTPGNVNVGDWEGWDGTQWVSLTGGFYGQPISGAAIDNAVVVYDGTNYRNHGNLLVEDDLITSVVDHQFDNLLVGSTGKIRFNGSDLQGSLDSGDNWISLTNKTDPSGLPEGTIANQLLNWNASVEDYDTPDGYGEVGPIARGASSFDITPEDGTFTAGDRAGFFLSTPLVGYTIVSAIEDGGVYTVTLDAPITLSIPEGTVFKAVTPASTAWLPSADLRLCETKTVLMKPLQLFPWDLMNRTDLVQSGGMLRYNQNDFQGFVEGRGWVSLTEQAIVQKPTGQYAIMYSENGIWKGSDPSLFRFVPDGNSGTLITPVIWAGTHAFTVNESFSASGGRIIAKQGGVSVPLVTKEFILSAEGILVYDGTKVVTIPNSSVLPNNTGLAIPNIKTQKIIDWDDNEVIRFESEQLIIEREAITLGAGDYALSFIAEDGWAAEKLGLQFLVADVAQLQDVTAENLSVFGNFLASQVTFVSAYAHEIILGSNVFPFEEKVQAIGAIRYTGNQIVTLSETADSNTFKIPDSETVLWALPMTMRDLLSGKVYQILGISLDEGIRTLEIDEILEEPISEGSPFSLSYYGDWQGWDGDDWVSFTGYSVGIGGGGGSSLPDGESEGQILIWSGTEWIPFTFTPEGLPSGATEGDVLIWSGTEWASTSLPNPLPSVTTPGQMMYWNGSVWAASSAPSAGQILKWNGSVWAPATDETGSGGTSLPAQGTAGNLLFSNGSAWATNSFSALATGHIPYWNGSQWANSSTVTTAKLTNLPSFNWETTYTDGQLLAWNGDNGSPQIRNVQNVFNSTANLRVNKYLTVTRNSTQSQSFQNNALTLKGLNIQIAGSVGGVVQPCYISTVYNDGTVKTSPLTILGAPVRLSASSDPTAVSTDFEIDASHITLRGNLKLQSAIGSIVERGRILPTTPNAGFLNASGPIWEHPTETYANDTVKKLGQMTLPIREVTGFSVLGEPFLQWSTSNKRWEASESLNRVPSSNTLSVTGNLSTTGKMQPAGLVIPQRATFLGTGYAVGEMFIYMGSEVTWGAVTVKQYDLMFCVGSGTYSGQSGFWRTYPSNLAVTPTV